MFSLVLLAILFLLSLIWFMYYRPGLRENQFSVPGVAASDPELGNLGDIGKAGSLHQYLTHLHRKFGPIVSFYWFKEPVVSIASPEAFHQTRRLFDRPISLFAQFEPMIGKHSIQYANGDIGKSRRKNHYDAALSLNTLRHHFFDIFETILRDKLQQWQQEQGQSIALHNSMLAMAIRSVMLAIFGSSISSKDEQRIEQAYNICWHEMEMRVQGNPTDEKREVEFRQAQTYFFEKVKEIIAETHQRSDDGGRKCFIDYLLDDSENVVSEEHICHEVITMFVGGFHTTGNLLTWILYYLAKDQDIQQRLYDELVHTYETEFPSFDQMEQMSYLNNIFNESLRLSVLAPWAARIATEEDLVICGHRIPVGTSIIQALGVVLQDENIWPNPDQFDPDRFNPVNKKKLPTFAFSPFGFAGKRICPGYRFAQYEACLFIIGIIRAFHVTLVDPTSPVIPVHGLVTAPKDEIFVQLTRRE